MSMLAERKRKTKWVLNPTKKPIWATESSGIKFGKKLMEKMGWSAGKGLGANEQGIQEPLKVFYKNDTKGMGFKGNDEDWIEHQDEFNMLLKQLRSSDNAISVENLNAEKNEIKSLEEKSKQSRARVHYQKFTRGKDLSKYSENDLACILGLSKRKKEKNKSKELIQTNPEISGDYETSFGVTTINSGSINDYFKKKSVHNKTKINNLSSMTQDTAESFSLRTSEKKLCFSVNNEDNINLENEKKDHKKLEGNLSSKNQDKESKISQLDNSKISEKLKKKKRKIRRVDISSEEEPESKKNKKYCDVLNETLQDQDHLNTFTKDLGDFEFKKNYEFNSIKKRNEDKNVSGIKVPDDNEKSKHSKKKKKKKEKCLEANSKDVIPTKVISNKPDEMNTKSHVEIRNKMTKSFFNEKEADKYAPGDRKNSKVLNLIRWVNISEFKGSNLDSVEGYGRRKMYEKQFR